MNRRPPPELEGYAAAAGGVPFEEQQFEALTWETGVLDLSEAEMSALVDRLRPEIAARLGNAP